MQSLIGSYQRTGTLHHAYLIEGEREAAFSLLCDFLDDELGFPVKANPDLWRKECDTFGIDDARDLKEWQSRKSVAHERKISIVIAHSFTMEAQNALLKVFEEPAEGTHFFVIADNADIFLPTLRSRLSIVSLRGCAPSLGEYRDFAEHFLKKGKAERIASLQKIIEEKDKHSALSFLSALEVVLHERLKSSNSKQATSVREILRCKRFLYGRAPSVKIILEHLALTIPRS